MLSMFTLCLVAVVNAALSIAHFRKVNGDESTSSASLLLVQHTSRLILGAGANTTATDIFAMERERAAIQEARKFGKTKKQLVAAMKPAKPKVAPKTLTGCINGIPKRGGDPCASLQWTLPICSTDARLHCCGCAGGVTIECQEGNFCPRPKVNYFAKHWREEVLACLMTMKLMLCMYFPLPRRVLLFLLSVIGNYFLFLSNILLPIWPFGSKRHATSDRTSCTLSGDEAADDESDRVRTGRGAPKTRSKPNSSRMSSWLREAPIVGGRPTVVGGKPLKVTGHAKFTRAVGRDKERALSTIKEAKEDSGGSDS